MRTALWLGSAAPRRSIRWLDGALAAAAALPDATAIAAGEATWLDLVADRATRAGLASLAVPTDVSLDYLGWAKVAAAAARQLTATFVLVDEASRPERFPEVAAIAELLGAAQVTRVIALAPELPHLVATRAGDRELQHLRISAHAVIGVRIAGPAVEEYPTPMPSASMKRIALSDLVDPNALARRALPPRVASQPRKTVERIAEHLAVHRVASPA